VFVAKQLFYKVYCAPELILSAPSLSSAASPFLLRFFLPPSALPDTACLLRRRLPLAGGSSAASAPEPPSTVSAGSASAGDCMLLSGVGNTCVHAVKDAITTCDLAASIAARDELQAN